MTLSTTVDHATTLPRQRLSEVPSVPPQPTEPILPPPSQEPAAPEIIDPAFPGTHTPVREPPQVQPPMSAAAALHG